MDPKKSRRLSRTTRKGVSSARFLWSAISFLALFLCLGTSANAEDIAGIWNYSESGTYTCVSDGVPEADTISGTGIVTIAQNGSAISWNAVGDIASRSGTIVGNSIQVSGVFLKALVPGVSFSQNTYTAQGTLSADNGTINLSGVGSATGSYAPLCQYE